MYLGKNVLLYLCCICSVAPYDKQLVSHKKKNFSSYFADCVIYDNLFWKIFYLVYIENVQTVLSENSMWTFISQ